MTTMMDKLNIALASDEWLKPSRYAEASKFFEEYGYDENGEVREDFASDIKEFIENLKEWDYDEFEIFDQNFDWSDVN